MGSTRLEIKLDHVILNRGIGPRDAGGRGARRRRSGWRSGSDLDAACCGIRGVDMVMAWSFEELARSEIDIAQGAAAGGRSSA